MSTTLPPAYSSNATFDGTWTATPLTIVICSALAGYNAIEALVLILSTFNQYRSLYFRALIVAATGVVLYMIALILWYFALTVRYASLIILYPGWICMVTGQSVVLYSRLGIVMGQERRNILRMVKWMIIIDAVIFHPTTIVIAVCSYYAPNPAPAYRAYHYIERLQITVFGIQELVLSGLYIWRTLEILRTSLQAKHRRIVVELMVINLVLIFIDIGTVTLEYCNLFFFEVAFKVVSYSIKLKLEFVMLSKLMVLSGANEQERTSRGNSLAFQTDALSTAGEVHRTPSVAFARKASTAYADEHNFDWNLNSSTMLEDHADTMHTHLPETTSRRKDSVEDYANVMRSLSKG